MSIPETYPNEPPKAFFRTKIFHPNVDDATGAVCVETLKRDWDSKLTLRDILITINCLLLQPNPSSALNAEAGMLLERGDDGWAAFERRAKFMTKLHAGVPKDWKPAVQEAQSRGNEGEEPRPEAQRQDSGVEMGDRRRGKRRRAEIHTPLLPRSTSEDHIEPVKGAKNDRRPFVVQPQTPDDVFGIRIPPPQPAEQATPDHETDDHDHNQENDTAMTFSPIIRAPITSSPQRQGPPQPLSELPIHSSSDDSFESEYPPSPRKSPQKQRLPRPNTISDRANDARPNAESSHAALLRSAPAPTLFTPREQKDEAATLALFTVRKSARAAQARRNVAPKSTEEEDPFNGNRDRVSAGRVGKMAFAAAGKGLRGPSPGRKSVEERRRLRMEKRLWAACAGDLERWNSGDFGGVEGIQMARW